jgi:flagella basal body P-ring formation protein FlgA
MAQSDMAIALVRVRAETTAQGEQLTLGDIAEVSSTDATVANRLRGVTLGYAPNVGAVREVTREKINLAVAAAGYAQKAVRVEAPPLALVRRASQRIDSQLLREAVERAVLPKFETSGATARLSRLDLPAFVEVPSGALEAQAQASGVRDFFTPFTVNIEIRVEGRIVQRLNATAQIEAFAPVLVAAHDIAANARVREADTRVEVRRLERAPSFYIREIVQLRGAATAREIRQGEALAKDALVSSIIVRPGDAVRIIGESNDLKIAVAGEARAAGRIGDRISVKNTHSGVTLQATIVDEGVVSVRF